MKNVSVVIPNWNGKNILERCLLSIKASDHPPYEVIIVDNGSTDDSIQIAKKTYPGIKIIRLRKNHGFSFPVNIGIKESKGKYIFLLNNDAEIGKSCLKYLVGTLKNKPDVMGITGKIINIRNKNLIDSAGDEINIVGQPMSRGVGDALSKWNESGFVFLITAAGSLFRKKAFDDIGLFDESFFAYYEDVDWCLRTQLRGFKFWYEPRAIIYHEHKFTSKENNKFLEYLQFRNQMQLLIKNYPWQLFFKRLRWIKIPLIYVHTFYFFISKSLLKEALSAKLWIFLNLLTLLLKRARIQRERKVKLEYLEEHMIDKQINLGFFKF